MLAAALQGLARPISLGVGEVLFHQGDPGGDLFVIEDGVIEISVISDDGRKLTLNTLAEGQAFGEIALLDEGPRTATAIALRETRLTRIARAALVAAIREVPDLGIELMALAGRRLRWVNALLEERAFDPLAVRLARRLCQLDAQARRRGEASVAIGQEELAAYASASRVAVANVLGAWKRDGSIRTERGRITLLDRERMYARALGEKDVPDV